MVRCSRCQTAFVVPPETEEAAIVTGVPVADPAPPPRPQPRPGPTEDNPFGFKAYPDEEESPRRHTRATNWKGVRLGFDLIFFATLLGIAAQASSLVALLTATKLQDVAVVVLICQVLIVVARFVLFVGMLPVCAVPPEAGSGLCKGATWTTFAAFSLSAVQIAVAFMDSMAAPAPGPQAKPPAGQEILEALTWPILAAELIAFVCWCLFLRSFALFRDRPGVAAAALGSLIGMLGYFALIVFLQASGILVDKQKLGEGTQIALLLFLVCGGLAAVCFYLGVLSRVRSLVVVKKKTA
jgi:hypothetical protein